MSKLLIAASSLALLAGPASALTAPELWADWQETMGRLGAELTAESEDYSDGRLVLKGLLAKSTVAGSTSDTNYGDVTLIDQDDGSVRIEVPTEMTQTSVVEIEGERFESSVRVVMEGLDAVARDDGEDRIYDVAAASMAYFVDDLSGGQDEAVTMEMAFVDYDTTTRLTADDTYAGTMTGEMRIKLDVAGAEPFTFSYEVDGIDGTIDGTIPDIPPDADFANFSDLGIIYDFALTHAGSRLSGSGETADGPLAFEGTSGGGRLALAIDESAFSYGAASTDVSMTVTPPALPLPIAFSAAEMSTDMAFPLAASDTPAPFSTSVSLQDLAVDEALWGLFDPTGQLPRDPATVDIDLSGTATVTTDLMDSEAMAELAGPPMTPNTLDISTLLVRIAGAELRGSGNVEWADVLLNPLPTGKVTIELDGGYGLLDKLVALGFVPPQQVAIVRGMAGAVAETVGDDQLRSELEFTEQGVLANGLPLPF